jgi:hypothetical protein
MSWHTNLHTQFKKLQYQTKQFWQRAWPLTWSNFQKPTLIWQAIQSTSYKLKLGLSITALGIVISLLFSGFGTFHALTTSKPSLGGTMYEGLVGLQTSKFNPVLDLNRAEQKITSLLYHPLYYVDYPNFLQNPDQKPHITPVLLAEEPTWESNPKNPDNKFHSLFFKLKPNLQWTDGSRITNKDIAYSFNRLKEEGGNSQFHKTLQNYEIQTIENSQTEFRIQPTNAEVRTNPQLKYQLNFRPISKDFYSDNQGIALTNEELNDDLRSVKVTQTSGFFHLPEKITPQNSDQAIENPTSSSKLGGYKEFYLRQNPHQNYKKPLIEKYHFEIYSNYKDTGGNNQDSLELARKQEKLDLITRFVKPDNKLPSSELQNLLNLQQTTQPRNTFFNLYLNVQPTRGNYTGYFINQTLRQYTLCKFLNYQPDLREVINIPTNRRLLPIGFTETHTPNCDNITQKLTNLTNDRGSQIYNIRQLEGSDSKRVQVFNNDIQLQLLALQSFRKYSTEIQRQFKEIGLPANVDWATPENLSNKLNQKNYHAAFLPVTFLNRDPYSVYGQTSRNLSSISQNPRLNGSEIEKKLLQYSETGLQDKELKQDLLEFFKNRFVSLNLFQAQREINYSSRINNLSPSVKEFLAFETDLYHKLPNWYITTSRQLTF